MPITAIVCVSVSVCFVHLSNQIAERGKFRYHKHYILKVESLDTTHTHTHTHRHKQTHTHTQTNTQTCTYIARSKHTLNHSTVRLTPKLPHAPPPPPWAATVPHLMRSHFTPPYLPPS